MRTFAEFHSFHVLPPNSHSAAAVPLSSPLHTNKRKPQLVITPHARASSSPPQTDSLFKILIWNLTLAHITILSIIRYHTGHIIYRFSFSKESVLILFTYIWTFQGPSFVQHWQLCRQQWIWDDFHRLAGGFREITLLELWALSYEWHDTVERVQRVE